MSSQQQKGTPIVIELCREVLRSNLAATCGGSVSLLVMAVAHKQDHLRRPGQFVEVYADELKASIGISRDKSFREVRQRAVNAGWLTFQSGGTRAAGKYAAHLPMDYGRSAPLDAPQVAPLNPDDYGRLAPSIPANSLSSVLPNPLVPSDDAQVRDIEGATPSKPRKKPRPPPAAEDMELAEFIWQAIHAMQPNRKPPSLALWANDIRLMREADKRTPDEIRQVFLWANADNFWQTNILCPEKLRSKFDDLTLRMQKARKGPQQAATTQQPQAMPIDPNLKRDV